MYTIYSKPGCGGCRRTKKAFEEAGMVQSKNFEVIDVTQDPEALNTVRGYGYMTLPVVVRPDGSHWGGFNDDEIRTVVHSFKNAQAA